jgi:hypothetical protein
MTPLLSGNPRGGKWIRRNNIRAIQITGSDLVPQQVAGYLKNEVAKEENSREESVLLASDS